MKRGFLILASALAGLLVLAPSARAECKLDQILQLPVTMVGTRPTVAAKLNGQDAQFLADSGAFYSIITPGAAAEYSLPLRMGPPGIQTAGVGGGASLSVTTVKSFTLAGVTLPNVQFFVGGSEGGGAGLLGQNVLGLADVDYDLAGGAIRLMRPHGCEGKPLAYWATGSAGFYELSVFQPDPVNRQSVGEATVNGVRIRVLFDTGASRSVLSLRAAARAGIKPGDPGVTSAGYSHGVGRHTVETWIAPVASFAIGGEEVRNTRLRIGDFGGPDVDMLLGADFFLSHRVFIANSQGKLYFTYNGGPVFNLSAGAVAEDAPGAAPHASPVGGDAGPDPTDAEGFSRRGAAFAARQDFVRALADFDKACAMAPTEPRYFLQRAGAKLQNHQPFLAMADLDQTVKLKPDDLPALLLRAELRLAGGDHAGALADATAAASAAAPAADQRLVIGTLFGRLQRFEAAVAQYDLWIAAHPDDSRVPTALSDRCRARAFAGQELQKALADCERAIRIGPKTAVMLEARGLAELRLGDLDKSIADFDGAVALQPRNAWALYGRGLAKQRKGLKAEGDADLAAATAVSPKIGDEAKALGLAS